MSSGTLVWHDAEASPAPKDRLILVTSGWGWRREDTHIPERQFARTKRIVPARHYKTLKPIGAVVMVYWLEDKTRTEGGVWIIAGNEAAFFHPFRWWADVNNPLSADQMAEHDPTFLVSNHRPEIEAMTPYVPGPDEVRQRELLKLMGL